MKKKTSIIVSLTLLPVLFIIGCFLYDHSLRNDMKNRCGGEMDCACFSNIIDNRLSRDQIRAFLRLSDSIRVRPNANILEFTDEQNAREISNVVSICRKNKTK